VTWHTFRHTFASRPNGNGTDLVTLKEILGHSDIKTTLRYAYTNREAKTSAVGRLGDIVNQALDGSLGPPSPQVSLQYSHPKFIFMEFVLPASLSLL
jgi:hypothetical protein